MAPLTILMLASEAAPFAKTGGLADVVGPLGAVLARLGHRVAVVLPGYRDLDFAGAEPERLPGSFDVPLGPGRVESATLRRLRRRRLDFYFVDHARFFDRDGLYAGPGGDHPDNDDRFLFFTRAALEAAKFVGFRPDVVHAHDWQTAFAPALLKTLYRCDAFYARAVSFLNVHNLAYQGVFPAASFVKTGLPWEEFRFDRFEYHGKFSLLKSGLVAADRIVGVSPNYVRESLSDDAVSFGLGGVLRHRRADYIGIVNGVDLTEWDPRRDAKVAETYGLRAAPQAKAANKRAIGHWFGRRLDRRAPLVGVVSRFTHQKGIDALARRLPDLVRGGAAFAVVGGASPSDREGRETEDRLRAAAARYPDRVAYRPFSLDLPHLVFAAAEYFLMPSRFEPCGMAQQFAMRYGAVPVATRVGGLVDTVRDAAADPARGTGWFTAAPDAREFADDVLAALRARRSRAWTRVARNGMRRDASWAGAARAYVEAYRAAGAGLSPDEKRIC